MHGEAEGVNEKRHREHSANSRAADGDAQQRTAESDEEGDVGAQCHECPFGARVGPKDIVKMTNALLDAVQRLVKKMDETVKA